MRVYGMKDGHPVAPKCDRTCEKCDSQVGNMSEGKPSR